MYNILQIVLQLVPFCSLWNSGYSLFFYNDIKVLFQFCWAGLAAAYSTAFSLLQLINEYVEFI